jgi:hypothetical protein
MTIRTPLELDGAPRLQIERLELIFMLNREPHTGFEPGNAVDFDTSQTCGLRSLAVYLAASKATLLSSAAPT